MLDLVTRTPLAQLGELPLRWMVREVPKMIDRIMSAVGAETAWDPGPVLGDAELEELTRMRPPETAAAELPRDLAALHSVLAAALARRELGGAAGSLGPATQRLAEVFGSMQAAVTEALVRQRHGRPQQDPVTGLRGGEELQEWLGVLLANHVRYGTPLAMVLIDVEGLGRINDAFGRRAGDRMLVAVAAVISGQVRLADRVFRTADGEFCVLVPNQTAEQARPLGERLLATFGSSQAAEMPHVDVALGIAGCPEDGAEPGALLTAGQEAAYRAKASGNRLAMGAGTAQDPSRT